MSTDEVNLPASMATPTPDPTDKITSSTASSDQLSTGIAVGVVIGGFLVVVFIVVGVVIMVRKRKKKDYTPPVEDVKENVAYGVAATGGPGLENNLSYGAFSEFTFCLREAIAV